MPKLRKQQRAPFEGRYCPNPLCKSKFFQSPSQLRRHLGAKHNCTNYLESQRLLDYAKITLQNPPPFANNNSNDVPSDTGLSPSSVHNAVCAFNDSPATNDSSVATDDTHDNFVATDDTHISATDYEHINFELLNDDGDNDNVIINPAAAVYTNSRRVEVILLKLLTEIEAPLWAFKNIMEWAFDAAQSGYNFTPIQTTYQAQLSNLEQWVCMEHLMPKIVEVKLPGVCADDSIPVTVFNFVAQLHSLLSDPELQVPSNLTVNSDDPFT